MSTTVTAPTPSSDALIERLNWRYAAKKMDPAQPVPEDKVTASSRPRAWRRPPAACSPSS